MQYMGVKIKDGDAAFLTEQGTELLNSYYCREGETPQMAFARAASAFSGGDKKLAQRIYDYVSNGWFMFSSPVLSNAPMKGEKPRAMPISCFLSYVPDSLEGLIEHTTELRWLSVKGGGVGGHWSDVRSISDIAPGPIPFLNTVDSDMTAYRQGKTRKGSYAAYMDIDHPDIIEFINMRTPTGDINRKCLNLHHAVNISDDFMEAVDKGKEWNLKDPNDGTVRETMKARKLWELLLETRYRTGEPYLFFIDAANRALPEEQKKLGLKIHGSNLCLTGDSKVYAVDNGGEKTMSIKDIAENHKNEWIKVLSYDISEGKISYQRVLNGGLIDENAEVLRIEDGDTGKVIECTPEHKIFTSNRGYVLAKDLNEDDKLFIA